MPADENAERICGSSSEAALQLQHLLGEDQVSGRVWRVQDLSALDALTSPCWVFRPISEPGGPRTVMYANAACTSRMGRMRSEKQVLEWFEQISEQQRKVALETLKVLHRTIQVKRETLTLNMNISRYFVSNFTDLPDCFYGHLVEKAIDIEDNGRVLGCYLCHVEREVDSGRLRNEALSSYSPIHSYLVNASGDMLHANASASRSRFIRMEGANMLPVKLEQLLNINGVPQPQLAQAALDVMVRQKAMHHQVVLTSARPSGAPRHTLYEFWPAEDPANSGSTAFVVSSFDVTHLKETELQLRSMELALQRRNADLQQQVETGRSRAASLESERTHLRQRLKEALQLHMMPKVALSTTSPIDLTIQLLDELLEGEQPSVTHIMKIRNELMQGSDLRAPQNLAQQLQSQKGITEEAGRNLLSIFQEESAASRLAPVARNRLYNRTSSASPVQSFSLAAIQQRFTNSLSRTHSSSDSHEGAEPCHPLAHIMPAITPRIQQILTDAQHQWDYDMLELHAATNGHPLSCYAFFVFKQAGLIDHFKLAEQQMVAFLLDIETGYNDDIPYHNRTHAASVLHYMSLLTNCEDGLKSLNVVEEIMEASLYMAAICHDFDHPGLTNEHLIRSGNPLAVFYNDKSPLENHHAASSFQVFYRHFRGHGMKMQMDPHVQEILRATVIDLIMATDMKNHFALISRLQGAYQLGAFAPCSRRSSTSSRRSVDGAEAAPGLAADLRMLAAQCALKAADLGHLALPSTIHNVWVLRLQEEWHRQGDLERTAGMPISALMDRHKPGNLPSSQIGFFELCALPLFTALSAVLPATLHMQNAAMDNYYRWLSQAEPRT